jgi:mono/diheme cytochrome c family protein
LLEVRGAVREGPHALGAADLDRLPKVEVRGTDPRTGETAAFGGTPLKVLVSDRVNLAKGADTAVIHTADGRAIPVPLVVIRQLGPVLAIRANGARLAKPIVAWPTEAQRGFATDPRAISWWARDVVAIEVVLWQKTYAPALAPPEGASDEARRGAEVYVESCIGCHKLRGMGGERGPELGAVAERLASDAFVALLPGHPGAAERRLRDTSDAWGPEVWAFLRVMATAPPPTQEQAKMDKGSAGSGDDLGDGAR